MNARRASKYLIATQSIKGTKQKLSTLPSVLVLKLGLLQSEASGTAERVRASRRTGGELGDVAVPPARINLPSGANRPEHINCTFVEPCRGQVINSALYPARYGTRHILSGDPGDINRSPSRKVSPEEHHQIPGSSHASQVFNVGRTVSYLPTGHRTFHALAGSDRDVRSLPVSLWRPREHYQV